jgi:RNA polymerase sigma-70 factor (ECF subfamily)
MTTRVHDDFLDATLPALDLVYNLSRRLVAGPNEVEDIVQETYARAFQAWCDGRKPRKVKPWIATICLNVGRSWLRRSSVQRERPSDKEHIVLDSVDVEEEALNSITRDALQAALWELPEEQRIAITLMDLCGFTASQVARMTGSPRGTVLARVHRGRKKLVPLLDKGVINVEP